MSFHLHLIAIYFFFFYYLPSCLLFGRQPSLSLDNTVEVFLLKNEGDFISVEQGQKLGGEKKKKKREDNIRQLLDVTNTITSEEMRDFEMRSVPTKNLQTNKWIDLSLDILSHTIYHFTCRYGSPHHCRSQSVKTPGRASGRPNQLSLPSQRSR